MAITITVRSGEARVAGAGEPQAEDLSLTFDTPRLVIGRSDGCDLRLPDPSVSHRHASIRQRGNEYVVVDEGSTNGTALDKVVLTPQSPRVIRSGEMVRLGRVWLEIRIDPLAVARANPAAARALALELVSRGLEAQGEEACPKIVVVEGPDAGKELALRDASKRYVLGRSRETDLPLDDPDASRRHVEIGRKGDHLLVRDLGSKAGAALEDAPLGGNDVPWRVGQTLTAGGNVLAFEYPATTALAELERSPDEALRPGEAPPPPGKGEPEEPAPEATPEPPSAATPEATPLGHAGAMTPAADGGWSLTDGMVLLFALGVLALSIVGFFWLFRG
jgi:pSer/pThr/pTyr-binding forkhead associated (FHA) protein